MPAPQSPDRALLTALNISAPSLIEQTAIATIWKVCRPDRSFAALKIYPAKGMGAEGVGFDFLQALDGNAAARVYARTAHAALIEWLDGPSLGDLTRAGHDITANAALVDVALRMHATSLNAALQLPTLKDRFAALFNLRFGDRCSPEAKFNLTRCKALANDLLTSQRDVRPLHGDLHHDNIRLGTRGYCAFDAKGVFGERSYELANAFRNPKGAAETVRNPARITHLATSWAVTFDIDQHRLLSWAAVKCALSIAWRTGGTVQSDDELTLLALFLRLLDDTPIPTMPSS